MLQRVPTSKLKNHQAKHILEFPLPKISFWIAARIYIGNLSNYCQFWNSFLCSCIQAWQSRTHFYMFTPKECPQFTLTIFIQTLQWWHGICLNLLDLKVNVFFPPPAMILSLLGDQKKFSGSFSKQTTKSFLPRRDWYGRIKDWPTSIPQYAVASAT